MSDSKKNDYEKILQCILDIGEEMLVCGGEVSRVQDSIFRMCESYGADPTRINVFIITSNIQVTIQAPDGKIITQIRCVVRNNPNFAMMDKLNDLSRYVCSVNPTEEELRAAIDKIIHGAYQKRWLKYLGGAMVTAGFTSFFGGTLRDAMCAGIIGVLIIFLERFLANKEKNEIVFIFFISAAAGMAAIALVKLGLGNNLDKIMIGSIMLMIPGLHMTNSIRDMLIGDLGSGLLRLTNALLVAGAIACGMAATIIVFGGLL